MTIPNDKASFEPDAPLSQSELTLLLALPRAAKSTPNATLFKIPCGPDPKLGFVDVSCAEAAAIVSRLAAAWEPRIAPLRTTLKGNQSPNIGIAIKPPVHGFFHHLAFWALGCCVQYLSLGFDTGVVDGLLRDGDCTTILYSGDGIKEWAAGCSERLKILALELSEEEFAINLAKREKGETEIPLHPWPNPRRPVPSIIIHSSASTSNPKLLRFTLQYWAQNLESHSKLILLSAQSSSSINSRASLMVFPPYWHTFSNILVLHLATLTPFALVHTRGTAALSAAEFLEWLEVSDARHVVALASQAREMLQLAFDQGESEQSRRWARVMRNMERIAITGSDIDDRLSKMFAKHGVTAMNLFGTSELGGLLLGTRPPYHHLRPYPDVPPPLVVPMSNDGTKALEESADGSQTIAQRRLVQLWTLVSSHPRLAHIASVPGVPIKIEPFPGPGPAYGQPATKWSDLFYELRVPLDPANKGHPDVISPDGITELVYVHSGRIDDHIRLSSEGDLSASEVESALSSKLEGLQGWELDAVQVFGTNRPHTALVVQLQRTENGDITQDTVVSAVRKIVEAVNQEQKLSKETQIDAYRRVLVVTTSGEHLKVAEDGDWGTKVEQSISKCGDLVLSQTHKRTLQRWKNAQKFEPWLEQVCGSG